ncbi:hypothetical protein [Novosphingobium sp.]|uniref:hypothetical protein n=1 Tax=Novosphingobium sp. TaxID=1874826 RepID=UPI001EB82F8A|nr:hypothetical protein [Novosphingobium sp.]MBK9009889.1 hypothetical protein [Novosphingobium sp.]
MVIGFALIPFAVSGLHLHFVAYLSDIGISPARAGAIAGIGGASLAIARIATGLLIDRTSPLRCSCDGRQSQSPLRSWVCLVHLRLFLEPSRRRLDRGELT